nr:type II secretion system F family protein [Oscillospiraceae bacterium]
MVLADSNIAYVCRSLALLLHSGVAPAEGCFLLAQETQDPLLTRLGEALDRGWQLSKAMEESSAFPASVCAMVRVGESTGRLEEALQALAEHYDYRHRTTRLTRQALAWPSLILLLMLLVLGVLLVKVLPVFDSVYASLGSGLAGPGAWLLDLGRGLQNCLPALLLFAAALAAAVLLLCCSSPCRTAAATLWRRSFGDRGILLQFNNARFARGLAMGLTSGLTPEEAAQLSELLLQEIPGAARRCRQFREALGSGTDLTESLESAGLITAAHSRLLAVGLRSGSGDRMMEQIADRMEEEAAERLEAALSRIEPAMVLCASVLVGGILLTVMLPLMNILSAIG